MVLLEGVVDLIHLVDVVLQEVFLTVLLQDQEVSQDHLLLAEVQEEEAEDNL